jgi:hypothetical protein
MLNDLRVAIDEFLQCPPTASASQVRTLAENALSDLGRECERVQGQANDYPANPIRGDVWMDGAMLGHLAEGLAEGLKQRRLTELEEAAHTLHCMAVLAVQSHYHHIVGPAMLARAECNERLDRHEFAVLLYTAVIDDFSWLLDDCGEEQWPLSDDQRLSLECLQYALERVQVIRPASDRAGEFERTLDRVRALLPSSGSHGAT